MMRSLSASLLLALVMAEGTVPLAAAANIGIVPIRVELNASGERTSVLHVMNSGKEPVTMQTQLVEWGFDGEEDVFNATTDLLLNPPIFTIQPNQTQFVRIGLRRRMAAEAELSYRLFLEEVPQPVEAGFIGMQTLLRISLPVFVKPVGVAVSPKLSWSIEAASNDALRIIAANEGNAHIQIQRVTLTGNGATVAQAKPVYLLAGQRREWTISHAVLAGAGTLTLNAQTDAGALQEDISVSRP